MSTAPFSALRIERQTDAKPYTHTQAYAHIHMHNSGVHLFPSCALDICNMHVSRENNQFSADSFVGVYVCARVRVYILSADQLMREHPELAAKAVTANKHTQQTHTQPTHSQISSTHTTPQNTARAPLEPAKF